jgi:hypothetical protein
MVVVIGTVMVMEGVMTVIVMVMSRVPDKDGQRQVDALVACHRHLHLQLAYTVKESGATELL